MKILCLLLLLSPGYLFAQVTGVVPKQGWEEVAPELSSLIDFARSESELRVAIVRYIEDDAALKRRYEVLYSPTRIKRLTEFYLAWQAQLNELSFEELNREGQIDYIVLRNRIKYDLESMRREAEQAQQIAPLLPFSDRLRQLQETRHDKIRVVPRAAADTLDQVAEEVTELTAQLASTSGSPLHDISPVIARRAVTQLAHLRAVLSDWNTFYNGYDPMFNFWVPEPYAEADAALGTYADAINEHLLGIKAATKEPIIGDPQLEEGLRAHLAVAMIPYSAEELIEIGEREFAWIEEQLRIVSNNMGFGDDWQAALEHAKKQAPPPGEIPEIIFDIADYSEEFIEGLDNLTVPPLAQEIWRLEMQTPERQLVQPFFGGGEVTKLSYPTSGMKHKDKLMSMRGNSPHLNFGTVQHELIPGHHLQIYMLYRFNTHRARLGWEPFWLEGWALYWEFLLWDVEFAQNDADKIGVLFWRLFRAARIVFSLKYHLGHWTPQQSVDYLVERVGHERANAEAEVRRTTIDPPLYQGAYMLGAMQFRKLYQEVVVEGDMTPRQFHDSVLQGGVMPVELLRARLTGQPLSADFESQWRFAGDP